MYENVFELMDRCKNPNVPNSAILFGLCYYRDQGDSPEQMYRAVFELVDCSNNCNVQNPAILFSLCHYRNQGDSPEQMYRAELVDCSNNCNVQNPAILFSLCHYRNQGDSPEQMYRAVFELVDCSNNCNVQNPAILFSLCHYRDQGDSPEQMYRAVFELVDRCNNPNVIESTILICLCYYRNQGDSPEQMYRAVFELVDCCNNCNVQDPAILFSLCYYRNQGDSPEQMYRAVFELVDRCNNPDVPNFALSRVDINPGYNSQTLVGDVAVATLEQSVPYTPVCLPPRNFMKIGEAVIIGFGSTLVKSPYPCTMQEARVNIFSKGQCARSGLAPEYSTLPGTICAGLRRGGVDSCDGDSGGPIQTIGPGGIYTIQGLVSFGEGCARRNLPGVYTQVSAYREFIDGIIRETKKEILLRARGAAGRRSSPFATLTLSDR
ncbi:hypothetical protein J6590_055456 [Homalodisca vitripennis]|nr:hypothetical protein J6590_055456 [Homalodisca vitripennis]